MSCNSDRIVLGSFGDQFDMHIKQGAKYGPFRFELTYEDDGTPFTLTGGTVRCEIRRKGLDTGPAIATPTISIDGVNAFVLYMSEEQTAAIPAGELVNSKESVFVHDIAFTDVDGNVTPLYFGNAYCFRRVTKGE